MICLEIPNTTTNETTFVLFFTLLSYKKSGLCISRGTATLLNFSCFMIFIPMCRTLTTWIRSHCSTSVGKSSVLESSRPPKLPSSLSSKLESQLDEAPQQSTWPQSPLQTSSSTWLSFLMSMGTVSFWSVVRRRLWCFLCRTVLLPFIDQAQKFHIMCAWTIAFAASKIF